MEEHADTPLHNALIPIFEGKDPAIIRPCINAVTSLPGLENWVPDVVGHRVAYAILSWGLPLSVLGDVPTLDVLRRKMAAAILKRNAPDDSDLSEVSGASLVQILGASITRVPSARKNKTPDFVAAWSDETVQLEVTRADKKPEHVRRAGSADRLVALLHTGTQPHDLTLHLAGPPDTVDESAILRAAQIISVGEVIEVSNRWQLRATTPDRHPHAFLVAGQHGTPPIWWPQTSVHHFSYRQLLAGPDTTVCPPQTRVVISIPLDAYLNPVQNKADRPQARDKAFVIAVDIQNLPGAMKALGTSLAGYFQIWPHLSGVLAFESLLQSDRIGWQWQLFPNPNPKWRLPPDLVTKQGLEARKLETAFRLLPDRPAAG